MSGAERDFYTVDRVLTTLRAMEFIANHLAQLPGRNLDIYAADLERIEVLEGPQGTLFGAGAQAGVLRYITNKPKIDVTEGDVDARCSASSATPSRLR